MGEPEPEPGPGQPVHGGDGTFVATVATAERDADAARLRSRGWSYRRIAAELNVDVHTAHNAVKRALDAIRAEAAAEVRELELGRLDDMYEAVLGVLESSHYALSGGKVVTRIVEYATDGAGNILLDDDGRPMAAKVEELKDDGPVLAAVDRLLKIQARRAALLGLDAEQKVSVSGGVKYEVVGIPAEDL